MQRLSFLLVLFVLFSACKPKQEPEPTPAPDPQGTIYYEENLNYFANPERGWLLQKYFESTDLSAKESLSGLKVLREGDNHVTLVLHSYYMMDYLESDIPQEFIDRMVANFDVLRQAGYKAILRFSYNHNQESSYLTYEAAPEWAYRHIRALAPYLNANSDVILCIQAGFIGVWGEWYYTNPKNYPSDATTDKGFEPRRLVLDTLLKYFPQDKQIALRTPAFKLKYMQMSNLGNTPLSAEEAYRNTARARLGAHNDAYVSSGNDLGTFSGNYDRTFWKADTKYVYYGGESCGNGKEAAGANALLTSEEYHLCYLNQSYLASVITRWKREAPEGSTDSYFNQISRRMGYRFVLKKASPTQNAKAGDAYTVQLTLRNEGFAAPHSPRDVEMILVSTKNAAEKYVFPQTNLDPRYWMPEDSTITCTLKATLPTNLKGTYNVYLNLPDAAPTLHDNPLYSIRLANKDIWEEKTGYNLLTTLEL